MKYIIIVSILIIFIIGACKTTADVVTIPDDLSGCWYFTNRNNELDLYEEPDKTELANIQPGIYSIDNRDDKTLGFKDKTALFFGEGGQLIGDYEVLDEGNIIVMKNFYDIKRGATGDLPILELILIKCEYIDTWHEKFGDKIMQ